MPDLSTEAQRRRAIAWATALTANTALAPQAYERALLERFARGELTIDQVLLALDAQVQHVLYRSQAVRPFRQAQLLDLLAQSRAYNAQHDITGLLCTCEGHFVQLLEGAPAEVARLYATIRQDPRHHEVRTLHEAAGPSRYFADWRMALVEAGRAEFAWLLTHFEARPPHVAQPQMPVCDPHVETLLRAFSQVA